jgi:quinol monooxygenase YgiN
MVGMLVVLRFEVGAAEEAGFLAEARTALAVLADRPGWRSSRIGRATDDPTSWVVVTEWDSVGAYRRALSSYDVKVQAVPLLSRARDEPSAFEVIDAAGLGAEGLAGPSARAQDADVTGPGAQRLP